MTTTKTPASDELIDAVLRRAVLFQRTASKLIREAGEKLGELRANVIAAAILDSGSERLGALVRGAMGEITAGLVSEFGRVLGGEIGFVGRVFSREGREGRQEGNAEIAKLEVRSANQILAPPRGAEDGTRGGRPTPDLPDLMGVAVTDWLTAAQEDLVRGVVSAVNTEFGGPTMGPVAVKSDFLLDVFSRTLKGLEAIVRTFASRLLNWVLAGRATDSQSAHELRWMQISVLDARTTVIRRGYAGKISPRRFLTARLADSEGCAVASTSP